MGMHPDALIDRLQRTGDALCAAVASFDPEEARARGPAGQWCALEIICHLCDEEVRDFRARVQSTLTDSSEAWPPTDPEAWPALYKYMEQDLAERTAFFARERAVSITWLRSLRDPDWSTAYVHPRVGPVPAGDLLTSWAAHDALHLRQLAKRLFELSGRDGAPYGTRYAGEWGA